MSDNATLDFWARQSSFSESWSKDWQYNSQYSKNKELPTSWHKLSFVKRRDRENDPEKNNLGLS
jgi:hypothetical protein